MYLITLPWSDKTNDKVLPRNLTQFKNILRLYIVNDGDSICFRALSLWAFS